MKQSLGTFEEEKDDIMNEIADGDPLLPEEVKKITLPPIEKRRRGLVRFFARAWLPYLNAAGLVEEEDGCIEAYSPDNLTPSCLWAPLWAVVYLRYSLMGSKPRLIRDVSNELMALNGDLDAIVARMAAARLSDDQHTRRIAQKALEWAMEHKKSGSGYPLPCGTLGARPGSPKEGCEDGEEDDNTAR